MPHQTQIITALKDHGLVVVEVAGWQTRGSSDFAPRGHVVHHDVFPPMTTVPDIIVNGRGGSDPVPGPLSQFWLERNGRVHLVAAGRANHAGEGSWKGLDENREVWGTEANNLGTPDHPWPEPQLEAWHLLCKATCDFSGFSPDMVCFHREWAPDRKVDPHTLDPVVFRRKVAEAGTSPKPSDLLLGDAVLLMLKDYHGDDPRPPLWISGVPHKVPGKFADNYAEGQRTGIIYLKNDESGRDHYDKVAALVEANN